MRLFKHLIVFLFLINNVIAFDDDNQERRGTFYFVRHGSTDWSMDALLEGPMDLPLNAKGKEEITQLTQEFEKLRDSNGFPTCIFHSSLQRCIETGHILKEKLSITTIKQVNDLQEVYRGDWSKLESEEKVKANAFLKEKKYVELSTIKVEDAEDWKEFLKRIKIAVDQCLEPDEFPFPIIVTHGQVVKEFLKSKNCWATVESKWKGENRPPLQVNYKGTEWSTKVME